MKPPEIDRKPVTKRFKGPNDRQRAVARGVIVEGKSFKQSAIDAGYSAKMASLGPAAIRRSSPGFDVAFIEQSKALVWQPEEVKAIIRNRLITDMTRGKSSGLERTAELLGRDKSIDLWVRTGDIQIGILAGIQDDIAPLSELKNALSSKTTDPPKDEE